MKAGQMDTQVVVQALAGQTRNSAGHLVPSYTELRRPWVSRRQTAGTESPRNDRTTTDQVVEFWGHWVDWLDVTTKHRLLLDGLVHNILRIDLARAKGSALIICTTQD